MIVLLIAGVGAIVAGCWAIWFGIPVKEFSFGNTMILAGVVAVCSGLLLIGLSFVVRELRAISRRLRSAESAGGRLRDIDGPPLPAGSIAGGVSVARASSHRDPFSETNADGGARPSSQASSTTVPWRDEVAMRDRTRPGTTDAADSSGPSVPEPTPPPPEKPRRNLLFASSLRKERDQPLVRTPEANPDTQPSAPSAFDTSKPEPHPSFDDAWPRADRLRRDAGSSRGGGSPPAGPDAATVKPSESLPPDVVVVKSGVVDGMAYSLYSDGSIEAQMPEGMMRFASIDELRTHLDQRS